MSGQKYTQRSNSVGFIATPVKKRGTNPISTVKAGERKWPI